MSAAWSERRTCGSVGGGRLFLCAVAQARLFLAQEDERRRDQGNMMMEALPALALEVIQAEFVLQLPGWSCSTRQRALAVATSLAKAVLFLGRRASQ